MFGKKYATPDGLQRTLLVSAAAAYVIGLVQTLNMFYQQSFTNPNFSGLWPILLWQVMPLAFFGLAYCLNPRKKLTVVQRLFEALLLAFIGIAGFTVVSQVSSYVMNVGALMSTGYESYLMYEFTIMSVMVVGFAGVLYFLARTKRWK